jgi:ribosomal protein S18 acetylase RimI-like enzyme
MIRPMRTEEMPKLLTLAEGTSVFKPMEINTLQDVLTDYHATMHAYGHYGVVYEDAGEIVGFAYFAPASATDRTWYLYWIAVSKQRQARGVGGALLQHAEAEIRLANGRLLIIETSMLPHYELTRRFYLKHGYEVAGVVRDFYADGDDLVIFRKHF